MRLPADKKWVMIDAKGLIVGRLATLVALRLRGKHKPTFTPHVDMGDNVIIINADEGGAHRPQAASTRCITTTPASSAASRNARRSSIMEGRFPERIVEKAVERMLPRGPLGRQQLSNLRVYQGAEHPHAGAEPGSRSISPK